MQYLRDSVPGKVLAATSVGFVAYRCYRALARYRHEELLRSRVAQFIDQRDAGIERIKTRVRAYAHEKYGMSFEDFLLKAKDVTELSLVVLIEKLRSGELTPTDALICYQAVAIEAHGSTNCVCWFVALVLSEKLRSGELTPTDALVCYQAVAIEAHGSTNCICWFVALVLSEKLRSGELTPTDALICYQAVAIEAHGSTNCICWFVALVLSEKLRSGELTPTDALVCYQAVAIEAHGSTNCICWFVALVLSEKLRSGELTPTDALVCYQAVAIEAHGSTNCICWFVALVLSEKLRSGELTPTDALICYQAVAIEAHGSTNCICWFVALVLSEKLRSGELTPTDALICYQAVAIEAHGSTNCICWFVALVLSEKLRSGELTPTDALICYQAVAIEAHGSTNCICWFVALVLSEKLRSGELTPTDALVCYQAVAIEAHGSTNCICWFVALVLSEKLRSGELTPTDALVCYQAVAIEAHGSTNCICWFVALVLSEKLRSGELTPTDALICYQAVAIEAHGSTNCICWFVDEANDWARMLDVQYANEEKPVLYGVPVSIKESISLKGYRPTAGFAANVANPICAEDAGMVQFFKQSGAIPFCTTNAPQSLFTFDCSNPVYGRTTNATDPTRSPGGSSGGEGALVGFGASLIGIGGDVAGSVRVPACYNGVVGFKPGTYFGYQTGSMGSIPGRPMIYGSVGPLARDVSSISLLCDAIVEGLPSKVRPYWPPQIDVMSKDSHKVLRVGVMLSNDIVKAMPECQEAVKIAGDILAKAGCVVVPWSFPEPHKIPQLYYGACFLDGGEYLRGKLANDIVDGPYSRALKLLSKGWLHFDATTFLRGSFDKNARVFQTYRKSTSELRQIYKDLEDYVRLFTQKWESSGLDAMICPVMPTAAPEVHEHLVVEPLYAFYNIVCNMLNAPAGSVPVLRCGDGSSSDGDPIGWFEKKIWTNGRKRGLPIGVQVITLPHEEKLCLKVMGMVERGVVATNA